VLRRNRKNLPRLNKTDSQNIIVYYLIFTPNAHRCLGMELAAKQLAPEFKQ